jgi:hypothetical protein
MEARLAAAVAAISVQLLLTVLGIAVGVSSTTAYEAANTSATSSSIPIAAGLWWLITGTLSLLVGGAVLGRLAGLPRGDELHLHAFTMWGVTAIFGFAVLWSGASMASAVASAMPGTRTSAAWATSDQSGSLSAERRSDSALTRDPQAVGRETDRRTVEATAEQARRAARTAAWWSVIGLCLGIGASLAGAWWAATDVVIAKPPING